MYPLSCWQSVKSPHSHNSFYFFLEMITKNHQKWDAAIFFEVLFAVSFRECVDLKIEVKMHVLSALRKVCPLFPPTN